MKRDLAGHPRRAGGGGAGATKSRFGHGDAPKPRRTSSCLDGLARCCLGGGWCHKLADQAMHEAVELTVAELAAVELRCKSLQESEAFRSERGSW